MGAPLGNKNAVGNRGGGRKTAREEKADAEWFWRAWNEPTDIRLLEKKVRSGWCSGRDVFLLQALLGNIKFLKKIFDKIVRLNKSTS
jgi:hypothetical protein